MKEQEQRICELENALSAARDELQMLSEWRKRAWAYDRDTGAFARRDFIDIEEWNRMKGVARSAAEACQETLHSPKAG
jgi:hypothetical protein